MDLCKNHQICTKYASWDSRCWYWKWEALTLTFKVIWPLRLTKRHSMSLLYTDLDQSQGATCPECALVCGCNYLSMPEGMLLDDIDNVIEQHAFSNLFGQWKSAKNVTLCIISLIQVTCWCDQKLFSIWNPSFSEHWFPLRIPIVKIRHS